MDVNNKGNDRKNEEIIKGYMLEIHNAIQKNDVSKVRRSIVEAIETIMEKNMAFDECIVDLLSTYMRYEPKSNTPMEYLNRRSLIFAAICKNRPVDISYLKKMETLTKIETMDYYITKLQDPKLKDEEILRRMEGNALPYEVEEKKLDEQFSEELASADSALSSSTREYYLRNE